VSFEAAGSVAKRSSSAARPGSGRSTAPGSPRPVPARAGAAGRRPIHTGRLSRPNPRAASSHWRSRDQNAERIRPCRPVLGPTIGPANMVCRGGGPQKPLQGRGKLVPPAVGLAAAPARLAPPAHKPSAPAPLRFGSARGRGGGRARPSRAGSAARSAIAGRGRLSASPSLPAAGGTGSRGRELGPWCVETQRRKTDRR
jgi:hypothetical protein